MSEMGLGSDGYFRVQKETTYGTGVTGSMTLLPVMEGTDFIHTVQNIENANLIASRVKQAPDLGRKVTSGNFPMNMHPSLVGTLWNFLFGAASSAAVGDNAVVHTWLQDLTNSRDGSIFTSQFARGAELAEQYVSCMITKIIIEANNEGNSMVTCECIAKDRETDKPRITSFSFPTLVPYKFCHLVVSEDSLGAIEVDNMTLEIDMNYDLERYKLGDCTPKRVESLGIPIVTMNLTLDADQQYIDAAIAHTAYSFTLTWTGTDSAGTTPTVYSQVIELPGCRINPETSVPLTMERLKMELEIDCGYGGVSTGSGTDAVMYEFRTTDTTATYTA